MKNYADRGGCYLPKPKAEEENTLREPHNFSYHTQATQQNVPRCELSTSSYPMCTRGISVNYDIILNYKMLD